MAKKLTKQAPRKAAQPGVHLAAAGPPPAKEYFKSPVKGIWIECDYDPDQDVYDNCHKVSADQVPASAGGDMQGS